MPQPVSDTWPMNLLLYHLTCACKIKTLVMYRRRFSLVCPPCRPSAAGSWLAEPMKRVSMEGYGLAVDKESNKRLSSLWVLIHHREMNPSQRRRKTT